MQINLRMSIGTFSLLVFSCLGAIMTAHGQKSAGQTVSVNGVELYYEKFGKGTPLLLLHGWTQTGAFWVPYVQHFQSEYEVYVLDLRGHGRSSPLRKDFSIQQAARDMEAFIEKLQLRSAKAIGLSFGGLVLLELASQRKDLLTHMAVIGTSFRYNGQEAQKGKPAFRYESLDPAFSAALKEQHRHGESQIRSLFDPTLNYQINLSETQLKNLSTNVLLIQGDSDEIAGIQQAVDMHRLIPHSALWIVPQTGHLALTEDNQEAFVRQTKAFFASPK